MKTIFFLILLVTINFAEASNYYFSTNSGDDSRTSSQANHPGTPWKTLDKLNSFFNNLKPGDSVLLKRGETFYGSIIINKSGSASSPIVIAAYGTGLKPVVTGMVPLTGFTNANNIWTSAPNASLGANVSVVLMNNVLQRLGRYPNIDAANKGYLSIKDHSEKTSISDDQLSNSPNWTGATVVIRSNNYTLDKAVISSYNNGVLTFPPISVTPGNGRGYFIENDLKTLDEQGEWYYNPATKQVSIYSTNTPTGIEASAINSLVTSTTFSYITFYNITFKGANGSIFNIGVPNPGNGGDGITIKYCDINFAGANGIYASRHSNIIIQNNSILNSLNDGILIAEASNSTSSGGNIIKNFISNTQPFAGMGKAGGGNGVYFKGGINMQNNSIIKSGYCGIKFDGNNAIIKNNFIDSFCTILNDGGGIYTYIGKGNYRNGQQIINNIIINGIGAPEGTTGNKDWQAQGIYFDENTSGVLTEGNTIANCEHGIVLNPGTTNNVVRNNTFFNNQIQLFVSQKPGKIIRNNIITQNILFSKLPSQLVSYLRSADNDQELFGRFDSNYYAKFQNKRLVVYNNHLMNLGNSTLTSEIEGWKNSYGKDETMKSVTNERSANNDDNSVLFEINPTESPKTISLNGNYADVKNNKYSNQITLQPYTSAVLVKQK